MKQLKLSGFKEEILITVYRSHVLSHFSYGSPIYTAATASLNNEMERVQTRALKIIGLTDNEAADKYGITTIAEFILNNNVTIIRRILNDQHHPLTIKLTRTHIRETRTAFRGTKNQDRRI